MHELDRIFFFFFLILAAQISAHTTALHSIIQITPVDTQPCALYIV